MKPMQIPKRKTNREAVARSLRELETLFGKKPPATKGNAERELGAGATGKLTVKTLL